MVGGTRNNSATILKKETLHKHFEHVQTPSLCDSCEEIANILRRFEDVLVNAVHHQVARRCSPVRYWLKQQEIDHLMKNILVWVSFKAVALPKLISASLSGASSL